MGDKLRIRQLEEENAELRKRLAERDKEPDPQPTVKPPAPKPSIFDEARLGDPEQ